VRKVFLRYPNLGSMSEHYRQEVMECVAEEWREARVTVKSSIPVIYPGPTVPCTPYLYLDRLASGLLRLWINVCVW